jgi:chitin-binding protein
VDGRAQSASSLQHPARGLHRRAVKPASDLTKLIVRAAGVTPAIPSQSAAPVIPPGRHHAQPPEPPPPAPPEPSRSRFTRRQQLFAAAGLAAAASIAVPLLLLWTPGEQATGTTTAPASRGYACRPGTEARDTSPACRAAAEIRPATDSDDAGLGDGTDIGIPDVGNRHREVIPDTRLCSAGRERYRGLDLARSDWPATALTSGGTTTLQYRLSGDYTGTVRFYLTKVGYDPNRPLTWAALDSKPLGQASGSPGDDQTYQVQVRLPVQSGRHLIYTVWERADDDAALYACSDVVFGGTAGSSAPTDGRTPAPGQSPVPGSQLPSPTVSATPRQPDSSVTEPTPKWVAGVRYDVGDEVVYDNITYRCLQPHRSIHGWEPDSAPAFWELATA